MKRTGTNVNQTEKMNNKQRKIETRSLEIPACESNNEDPGIIKEPRIKDQAVQVYFPDEFFEEKLFVCNRSKENGLCEAETQTNIPLSRKNYLSGKKTSFTDKCCGTSVTFADKIVGPDPLDLSNKDSLLLCRKGFHGFNSLRNDQNFLDIAGVNLNSFNLLLKVLGNCKEFKVSKEDRLLIFLVKMKLGSTFSAIGVLFGVHRSTISRIFYATLEFLSQACTNFIQWPSKETIKATLPDIFKETYPDCRVTIDCTEFKVEQPPEIDERFFLIFALQKRIHRQSIGRLHAKRFDLICIQMFRWPNYRLSNNKQKWLFEFARTR